MDMDTLVAAARALMEAQPRTSAELRLLLGERWPDRDAASLAQAVRNFVPLIHTPPRGVWGASGQVKLTTAECWLDRPLDADSSPDEMILRYLGAFGPATVADMQAWSGLTRLREAVTRLEPRLRTFRDEHGKELFDLPDAPRPDPNTPAPPRFLPEYDNLLLSHADRTRVITDEDRKRVITNNGILPGTFLIDGFVGGMWNITRKGGAATLLIRPFKRLPKQERAALAEEAALLLMFTDAGKSHDVRFEPA
jgi:hypothetical protein